MTLLGPISRSSPDLNKYIVKIEYKIYLLTINNWLVIVMYTNYLTAW